MHTQYHISTDPSLIDLDLVHRFLSQESYWAKQIPLSVVKRAIEHSLCFGVYADKSQVGFARVVTDYATFAYLADVFIVPEHRGQGLSKELVQTIHAHPSLQGLRRWMLMTLDAHGLYESYGWERVPEALADRVMQRHDPDVYTRQAGE